GDFAWVGVLPEDVTLNPAMAATLWGTDERSARTTLRSLRDKALLLPGVVQPDGTHTYRLHDLLHDMARRLLTDPAEPKGTDGLAGLGLNLRSAHTRLLERFRARTQGGRAVAHPTRRRLHPRPSHLAPGTGRCGRGSPPLAA